MKKIYKFSFAVIFAIGSIFLLPTGCINKTNQETEEFDEYDGPDKAIEFEIERTRDLVTGKVPWEKLRLAIEQTKVARSNSSNLISALSWIERGPNGDFTVGGNPRPTGQQTSGRIRAVMIDSLDATHKTVWAGGIAGGLWKNTDITASPSNWTLINDNLANLAVSAICQDPRPGFQNNMYFCTGESFSNADAVLGVGVFKSTDAGATWNFLPSTSTYLNGTRILCDNLGNVYLGTRNTGLLRSTDGGTTWTNITPTGIGSSVCDLEISSTSAPGRLHVATGIFSTSGYRYTDNPATATSGSGWNTATTAFTTFNQRTELAISGNVLYACPDNGSHQVPTVWKSVDGGANWASTAGQPAGGWASGQGWYSLSAGINPANPNECIVGGLDCHKTTDGGASWTKITNWATNTTGFYVHADQHNIQWWDGGTKLMYACDGGIYYSTDGGINNNDRNKGLRIKQFYSVAVHPTSPNHFIGGTQDNGMHRLNHPGLDSSAEVVGGDGCYSAIDQNEPQYQFGSYVYNVYRRSTNNGNSWTTPVNNQSTGRFVNPWDYDNNTNIIYACNTAGNYLRWDDPQTGGTTNVISIAAFNGGNVSAVHASPFTAHRVFFGTGSGGIIQVDNANTASPTGTGINNGSGMPAGYVNCIVTGSTEQNMMACFTNYGVQNIWVTTNGGTTWTAIDGNLPDMPVRWVLFHPDSDTKAFIATETGVWETDLINGASTVWNANATFPNVRTDMIKYRSSDRTIVAGTHGRGIWTATIPPANCTPASITTHPSNITTCAGNNTSFSVVAAGTAPLTYQWQLSTAGAGGPWNDISNGGVYSGATTATISVTGATAGMNTYQYRCRVTGNCGVANSNAAVLTVNTSPVIATQPATGLPLCGSGNITYSVVANGTALTYQWQVSIDGGSSYNNLANAGVYSGVTTSAMTITGATAAMNTYRYRCVISGTCTPSVNSNAVALTVNTPINITIQPAANAPICATGTTSFTVAATGTTPTYQWQISTNAGASWTDVTNGGIYSGATTTTLTLTGVIAGMNGSLYRAVVSGAAACGAVNSTNATLTVSAQPTVSLTASPFTKLLPGQTTTITATVTPPTGVTTVWTRNGSPISVSGNTKTVSLTELGTYTVVATIGSCISAPASITISDSASSRLFIFPSPNNGLFTISYYSPGASSTNKTKQNITIYDSYGRRVHNKEYEVSQPYQLHQIDMRRNGAGVYYIVLREANGNKIETGEVIIR